MMYLVVASENPEELNSVIEAVKKIQLKQECGCSKLTRNTETVVKDEDWRNRLRTILNDLKVKKNLFGYSNLFKVIDYIKESGREKILFTGELYPAIAKQNKNNSGSVERSIRHLIECIWKNNTQEHIQNILGNSGNKKMTNKEFVYSLMDMLE